MVNLLYCSRLQDNPSPHQREWLQLQLSVVGLAIGEGGG